ncbi:MAG TPA: hypothetical protein VLK24_11925 [Gaiellaceae bacterium]|nr:hypothetical protein [Gaiellaceae bacterium]
MALLAILLLLFGFVFLGFGTFSSNTNDLIKPKPMVKCSKRMTTDQSHAQGPRCGPPPANP